MPPEPLARERRPKCEPQRVPHRGGHDLHNECADNIPNNSYSGWDALVNEKNFDGLQAATRTLWEVKTDNFDTYSPFLQNQSVENQLPGVLYERPLLLRSPGWP